MSNVFRSIKNFLSKKPGAIKTKDMKKFWEDGTKNFAALTDQATEHIKNLEDNIDKAEKIESSCTKLGKLKKKEKAINDSIDRISSNITNEDKETINNSYGSTQGTLTYIENTIDVMENARQVASEWLASLKAFSDEINKYLLVAKELTGISENKGGKSTNENENLLHKLFVLKNYQKLIVSLQNSYGILKKHQLNKKSAACSLMLNVSSVNENLTMQTMFENTNNNGFESVLDKQKNDGIDKDLLQKYQNSLEKLEKAMANRRIIANDVNEVQEDLDKYIESFATNVEKTYGKKSQNFWLKEEEIQKFFEWASSAANSRGDGGNNSKKETSTE